MSNPNSSSLPLYHRKDSPERGRHLVAAHPIQKNQLIFCERPLVSLQSISNLQTTLVCGYCRSFGCCSFSTSLKLASGNISRPQVCVEFPCRNACGQVYCSAECEADSWESAHSLLCTGRIPDDQPNHPLLKFKIHALQHNEVFFMVADVICSILLEKTTGSEDSLFNKYMDFTGTPWWQVATAPLLKSPTGLAEATQLDTTLRRLCEESSHLLQQALLTHFHLQQQLVDELCTPSFFARLIGSFEQNAIGIRQEHALCREILENSNQRQEHVHDLIQCLERAGMIGRNDDDSDNDEYDDSDNEGSNEKDDSNDEEENVSVNNAKDATEALHDHEYDYTNDELASFLAGLDKDDLDALFAPLDGTAMYATACKMNHSCDPNVVVLYRPQQQTPLAVYCRALRDVCVGEELCISYIASDEPLIKRQEALANYGFECQCKRCLREGAECILSVDEETREELEHIDDDDLFGPEDDDGSEESLANDGNVNVEGDGEARLQTRLDELDKELNRAAVNTIPVNVLAVACNHVIRVGAAALGELPPDVGMQECLEAVRARDFVQCIKMGTSLEGRLFELLQQKGSFPNTYYREAYGCGALTASIGHVHVGSVLTAQSMLDKAIILGLPRTQVEEYFSYVEYFADQVARGPCRPAIDCMIRNPFDEDSNLEPLQFPVTEAPIDIDAKSFDSLYVSQGQPVVIRNHASDWAATTTWR